VEVLTCGDIVANDPIGTKGTITDKRDGKVYKIVKMPDGKVWMAENLNYQKNLTFNARADQAKGETFITNANGVPAIGSFWCPQLAGTAGSVTTSVNTCNVYGALYTWETVMSENGVGAGSWVETTVANNYVTNETPPSDAKANVNNAEAGGRGICPTGFHVPTDQERANLLDHVEPDVSYSAQVGGGFLGEVAGRVLRSASTYVGKDPGDGAWANNTVAVSNDEHKFSLLPAGWRVESGEFGYRGSSAITWSSSVQTSRYAWDRQWANTNQVARYPGTRARAASVRCVKNQ
jgi:uncharacterized protein (TIGR02145 family)